MTVQEFQDLCTLTAPATAQQRRRQGSLPHDAQVLLYLTRCLIKYLLCCSALLSNLLQKPYKEYNLIPSTRLHRGWSFELLAGAFLCNRNVAKRAKLTIQLYLLMRDPLNSLPTILNSLNLTEPQVLKYAGISLEHLESLSKRYIPDHCPPF